MKVRLIGLPAEVTQALVLLRDAFDVVSESDPYPCRGASREVRVYVEVRLSQDRQQVADSAPEVAW